FLQIVALTRDVACHFKPVGETNARDLTKRRVRLLRGGRIDARTNTALLRAGLKGRHFVTRKLLLARLADELVDRRHTVVSLRPLVTKTLTIAEYAKRHLSEPSLRPVALDTVSNQYIF